MGAKSSKVYVTDWEKADGGMKHHFETLDRSLPFQEHHTLHLITGRKSPRDFSVTNEEGRALYTTSAVATTAFWFDVSKCDMPMVQVRGHPWGTTWHIYSYHHATFIGQVPTKNIDDLPNLYLKARVVLNFKKDNAQVQLCENNGGGKATWSKPILIYDDVNYLQGKGQTHLVGSDNLTSFCEELKPGELKIEVAKGCDIILQIVLSVIANQVHANTNPFMVHATEVPSCDNM